MQNLPSWCSVVINIIVLIMISYGYIKIMRNDLSHLSSDSKEIKNNISRLFEKMSEICSRISFLEGKLNRKK